MSQTRETKLLSYYPVEKLHFFPSNYWHKTIGLKCIFLDIAILEFWGVYILPRQASKLHLCMYVAEHSSLANVPFSFSRHLRVITIYCLKIK